MHPGLAAHKPRIVQELATGGSILVEAIPMDGQWVVVRVRSKDNVSEVLGMYRIVDGSIVKEQSTG